MAPFTDRQRNVSTNSVLGPCGGRRRLFRCWTQKLLHGGLPSACLLCQLVSELRRAGHGADSSKKLARVRVAEYPLSAGLQVRGQASRPPSSVYRWGCIAAVWITREWRTQAGTGNHIALWSVWPIAGHSGRNGETAVTARDYSGHRELADSTATVKCANVGACQQQYWLTL